MNRSHANQSNLKGTKQPRVGTKYITKLILGKYFAIWNVSNKLELHKEKKIQTHEAQYIISYLFFSFLYPGLCHRT